MRERSSGETSAQTRHQLALQRVRRGALRELWRRRRVWRSAGVRTLRERG
jgi:hypothetical protein